MTRPRPPYIVVVRHLAALVLACCLLAAMAPDARAQAVLRTESLWQGWHGPWADGMLDLRFGMDRYTAGEILRDKGYAGRPAREGTLHYGGTLLSEPVDVVLFFAESNGSGAGGRLYAVQLHWDLRGTFHGPRKKYERLSEFLQERYDVPLRTEEAQFNGLETGSGTLRRFYEGREALALLQLSTARPERFDLVLRLESPQLRPEPPQP